ncbi:MAG: hypothetical protein M1839_003296 [Geoglossum umbratile]|nr:MAG: hypothetical protein M1839_003296 [Geoglossum umbratile]
MVNYITTNLTNGGRTTHYQFSYDDTLSTALGVDRTNQLISLAETDWDLIVSWFGTVRPIQSIPISVQILNTPSETGAGWGPPITLRPGSQPVTDLRYLLVAEVTEMFMQGMTNNQATGWWGTGNEGSAGEALSRFLSEQFLLVNGLGSPPGGFFVGNIWMNSTRQDFVNGVDLGDHQPDADIGCGTLFLSYLHTQLGFSIKEIIAAAAPDLAGVYKNLTGENSDPFPFFKRLLDSAYPNTTSIATAQQDNPWPIVILNFIVDKSTFGKDEVIDQLAPPNNGTFPSSFWITVEGLSRQTLSVNKPNATLSFPGISFPASTSPLGVTFERPDNDLVPQLVRFPFDVKFTNASLAGFPAVGAPPLQQLLNGDINVLGSSFTTSTVLEFVSGADPYFTNVNPALNNYSYLSQDLVVFAATPGLNSLPVPGGPSFATDSITGAYTYIQALIGYLNTSYSDPSQVDPFNSNSGVIPQQGQALISASSVTPNTKAGGSTFSNYNFALARVRLRGAKGEKSENVKVFFRLWSTSSADTNFDPNYTYLSALNAQGLPKWPLTPADNHTIPFFATGNSPAFGTAADKEYSIGGVNNRSLTVASSSDSLWGYFGCLLNVYDPNKLVNGKPITDNVLPSGHHCLVAQIAYDDAPIVNLAGSTATTGSSDKLAQRNLNISKSDNPGSAATHTIPEVFDLKPTATLVSTAGLSANQVPDELMIDWGNTPVGSIASIYLPQVDVSIILDWASRLYPSRLLSAPDVHTVQTTVISGTTYIPIPPGYVPSFAGLLTLELPSTVVKGQVFNVIIRRTSLRRVSILPVDEPPTITIQKKAVASPGVGQERPAPPSRDERSPLVTAGKYVLGTFNLRIPVSVASQLLPEEEDTLAIFKWRLQNWSVTDRWYAVLQKYIQYQSDKVDGLGGNAAGVPPSRTGVPPKEDCKPKPPTKGPHHGGCGHGGKKGKKREYCGKVCRVLYGCHGELEGFVLSEGEEEISFQTCDDGLSDMLVRVCKQQLCVIVEVWEEQGREDKPEICKLIISNKERKGSGKEPGEEDC